MKRVTFFALMMLLSGSVLFSQIQITQEAETGGSRTSPVMDRGNANNLHTLLVNGAGLEASWTIYAPAAANYNLVVWYSNDNYGPLELVHVKVNGVEVGAFEAKDTGDYGLGWNVFENSPILSIGPLPPGTATIVLWYESGDGYGVEYDRFVLTGTVVPPSPPSLLLPPYGSTDVESSTLIRWLASDGAESYHLQVASDEEYSHLVMNQAGITGTDVGVDRLEQGTVYYWHVNATNGGGTSGWSASWWFRTLMLPPSMPVLLSPADDADTVGSDPDLRWEATSGATGYQIQVSGDSIFSSILFDQSGIADTSFTVEDLSPGSVYYWRVRGANESGAGPWSEAWTFTTRESCVSIVQEAENGYAGSGSIMDRGEASEDRTLLITAIETTVSWTVEIPFSGEYRLVVQYSNDDLGTLDSMSVEADTVRVGGFRSVDTGDNGFGWNVFKESPWLPLGRLAAGPVTVSLRLIDSDGYGIELDKLSIITCEGPEDARPELLSPGNGAVCQGAAPVLRWKGTPGATRFKVQVSLDPSFQNYIIDASGVSGTAFETDHLLQTDNRSYYWRVLEVAADGSDRSSDVWGFTVIPLDTTEQVSDATLLEAALKVFQLMRRENGTYADAVKFSDPQDVPCSIASVGMGLVSLCIADRLGIAPDARQQVLVTLHTMLGMTEGFQPARNAYGFYRHWIDIRTGARAWDSEFSTIDTGILTAGALFCKNYFPLSTEIRFLADSLFRSIDWHHAIKDPETGEIFMTFDPTGNGQEPTRPFNEYMIVAWLAKHESRSNQQAERLWDKWYADPSALPKSVYDGIEVLTDNPPNFLSSFVIQSPYYLCHPFTIGDGYNHYFKNQMLADREWWRKNTDAPDYAWGNGAGPDVSGYFADKIGDNPGEICSPQVIAGFIPTDSTCLNDLREIVDAGLGGYALPDSEGTPITWRFRHPDPGWRADAVAGVDWSGMVFGLAAHIFGAEFFADNNIITGAPYGRTSDDSSRPHAVVLEQNYPNPFNPATSIAFEIPASLFVNLQIFDLAGRKVATLIDRQLPAGRYAKEWSGGGNPSGIYLIQIRAGDCIVRKKMTLLK
jgi:hypothetical protein